MKIRIANTTDLPEKKYRKLSSNSAEMQGLIAALPRIANSDANVLILGESGTGKELVARALHDEGSRAGRKFIAINCAAVPESLLESQLFGHEKGAFTGAFCSQKGLFQEADGGTLFLDEIGDMPLPLQAKLLRVLQERVVTPVGSTTSRAIDFRLIAATHQNLAGKIERGEFRADLFYRLNVIPLVIPPLRERRDDVPDLVRHFVARYSQQYQPTLCFAADALEDLKNRTWRGNVRELENLIERMVVTMEPNGLVHREDLPADETESSKFQNDFVFSDAFLSVDEVVHKYILYVLERTGFHQGHAAKILGLSRRTIYRKLKSIPCVLTDTTSLH